MLRVLLVEDSDVDALIAREVIRTLGEGVDVTRLETLADARRVLQPGRFELVVVDLGLPDARGLDAVRVLRPLDPDVPLVVLTGSEDVDMGPTAVREGADDFLVKGRISSRGFLNAIWQRVEAKLGGTVTGE